MARQRTLKMEFWTDEGLATSVSRDARMLYMGLWNLCDEAGRCRGDARYLRGQIFPYEDDLSSDDVAALLRELLRAGRVRQYRVDGQQYIYLPKLAKHNRLEPEKTPSRLPEPPEQGECEFRENPGIVPEVPEMIREVTKDLALLYSFIVPSSSSLIGSRFSESSEDAPAVDAVEILPPAAPAAIAQNPRTSPNGKATRISPDFQPTRAMVAWARQKTPHVDGRLETEKFINYWLGKAGRDSAKLDWPATWRNWMLSAAERTATRYSPGPTPNQGGYLDPMPL